MNRLQKSMTESRSKRRQLCIGDKIAIIAKCTTQHKTHSQVTEEYIQVQFLPPNTTSSLLPMDQGTIWDLKCHYRGLLLRRYIASTLYFVLWIIC